jgi:uncharacterized damage-inducible protein DinB
MSLRATLNERLMQVWAGTPWHGSSSKEILGDLSAEEAAARPLPGAHTIWEITLHMVAWTEEVTSRVRGNHAADPMRGDWPAPTDLGPEAWAAATDELRTARYALLEAIEKAHEENLYMRVSPAGGDPQATAVTRAQTITGLADHDVYHLGQIAMLKADGRKRRTEEAL